MALLGVSPGLSAAAICAGASAGGEKGALVRPRFMKSALATCVAIAAQSGCSALRVSSRAKPVLLPHHPQMSGLLPPSHLPATDPYPLPRCA